MRKLALEKYWSGLGASFIELGGAQAVSDFGNAEAELFSIRNNAAVSDFSFCGIMEFDESEGVEFLDSKLAANILKLRYGKICDTFFAGENGDILAETLVSYVDDKIILISEKIFESANLPLLKPGISRDISQNYSLLSVDGPDSWKVARAIFGSDIFNLSYMSAEKYDFASEKAIVMRSGRTGEFGYQILVSNSGAPAMLETLLKEASKYGGRACGLAAHAKARLEGNFFNIFAEGVQVKNPLELGLQWMIDFSKPAFAGSEKILSDRDAGIGKSLVCALSETPLSIGSPVFDGTNKIGKVVASEFSPTLPGNLSLLLADKYFALPGFKYSSKIGGSGDIETLSRPAIMAQSLVRGMEQD